MSALADELEFLAAQAKARREHVPLTVEDVFRIVAVLRGVSK